MDWEIKGYLNPERPQAERYGDSGRCVRITVPSPRAPDMPGVRAK